MDYSVPIPTVIEHRAFTTDYFTLASEESVKHAFSQLNEFLNKVISEGAAKVSLKLLNVPDYHDNPAGEARQIRIIADRPQIAATPA